MKTLISLFILFFSILSLGYSQDTINRESDLMIGIKNPISTIKLNAYVKLYDKTLYTNPTEAKKYANEQLTLSEKMKYPLGIANANHNLGIYYDNIGKSDSARYFYQKAYNIYVQLNDLESQTASMHNIAIIERAKGNFDKALDIIDHNIEILSRIKVKDSLRFASAYLLKGYVQKSKGNNNIALNETLKALKIYKKNNDNLGSAEATSMLASIEFDLKNIQKAIDYDNEALAIYKAENDKFYEAETLLHLGGDHYQLKNYPQALEYLEEALKLSKEVGSPSMNAFIYSDIGKVLIKQKKINEGISSLKNSLSILQEINRTGEIVEIYNEIGEAYNTANQPLKAIEYVNKGIVISNSLSLNKILKDGYLIRSESYEQLKNTDKAFSDFKQFQKLKDTIFTISKSQQIEELRTIYETEKKEKEIAFQKNEIGYLEQKAKASRLQRLLLGIGFGFTLLFIGIGFYSFKQKIKSNKLEKEKLNAELEFKKKELTTHALNLARKNEVLEGLKQKAEELKLGETSKNGYNQLIRTINFDLQDDNNWKNFSKYFEEVHKDFNSNVKQKFPSVTPNEIRLLALLKMNLSSKEIASILNISQEGIKKARYRLRKKLDITSEESLQNLVIFL